MEEYCLEPLVIIINDAAYGSEKPWNALRLALASTSEAVKMDVNIFLMGDGVTVAKKDQNPPEGHYNLERMLSDLVGRGVKVSACGTCMNSRGLVPEDLIQGVEKGTMVGLARWIRESSKVLSF
jgi:uncharacterized protein involved in oxidation of intracellular sulfur